MEKHHEKRESSLNYGLIQKPFWLFRKKTRERNPTTKYNLKLQRKARTSPGPIPRLTNRFFCYSAVPIHLFGPSSTLISRAMVPIPISGQPSSYAISCSPQRFQISLLLMILIQGYWPWIPFLENDAERNGNLWESRLSFQFRERQDNLPVIFTS